MKYLTALELSEKWKISSRMITIHCKNGRISGAIKKGKVWFIPIDAQKPVDERKATRNIEAKGIAYTFLRFITLEEEIGQQFMELWILIK